MTATKPDQDIARLESLANAIKALPMPLVSSVEARAILDVCRHRLAQAAESLSDLDEQMQDLGPVQF